MMVVVYFSILSTAQLLFGIFLDNLENSRIFVKQLTIIC